MQYLLGIDIRNEGLDIGLYEETGKSVSKVQQKIAVNKTEFDPEQWWVECVKGIKTLIAESKIDPSDIGNIGFTCVPLCAVYMNETGKAIQPIPIRNGEFGTGNFALEPKAIEKATWILLPKDFLRFKFTEQAHTDWSGASAMNLLDNATLKWSTKWALEMGVPLEKLPTLKASHHVVGVISPESADETGLAMGTMVGAGAIDSASALFGMGLVNQGDMGTIDSKTVYEVISEPVPIEKTKSSLYHHSVPDKWIQVVGNPSKEPVKISSDASAYGAALLAGVAGGVYLSIEDCLKQCIRRL
jgi:xylulokinase